MTYWDLNNSSPFTSNFNGRDVDGYYEKNKKSTAYTNFIKDDMKNTKNMKVSSINWNNKIKK
jgi:hypothetical protein